MGGELDLYRPAGTPPPGGWPAVVAFPGGGWRWADKTQYGNVVGQLARYGFVVAVADYTFASSKPGSHVWPENFEDARAAVRWLRSSAARLDVNPGEIAAEGVSSGAHLASLLGTHPPERRVFANSLPSNPTAGRHLQPRLVSGWRRSSTFYGPVDPTESLQRRAPPTTASSSTFLGGTPEHGSRPGTLRGVRRYVCRISRPFDPLFFIVQETTDRDRRLRASRASSPPT